MNLAHQLLMGKTRQLLSSSAIVSGQPTVPYAIYRNGNESCRVAQYQDHLILSHSKDEGASGHEVVNATMEV